MPNQNDDSDSPEVISSSDEEDRWKIEAKPSKVPLEYWTIQKLIKYIKTGNQTTVSTALAFLKADFDLTIQMYQLAILNIGGVEVLVNLLGSNDLKSCIAALRVLADISQNIDVRRTIVDMNAIPLLMKLLQQQPIDVKIWTAETLANVAKIRLARKLVRKTHGLRYIVDLLDVKLDILKTPIANLNTDQIEQLQMARAGGRALATLSLSQHNKEHMRHHGLVPLIGRLLQSIHQDVVLPIMTTLKHCAIDGSYQLAITAEKFIPHIIRHLRSDNMELKNECSLTIYFCSDDKIANNQIRESNGLKPLVDIANDKKYHENVSLLSGAIGTIWKAATTQDENIKELEKFDIIKILIKLLEYDDLDVLTNTAGAIAECCRFEKNRTNLRKLGGIKLLVKLLNERHPMLLINLSKLFGEMAKDSDNINELEELDVIRLVWSLCKNSNTKVQSAAAFSLSTIIDNVKNPGENVRSLVGAIEIIIRLLKSTDNEVLAGASAAIASIAKDSYNLEILTDYNVIKLLSDLVNTKDELLREHLASAIAGCAPYGNNKEEFGRLGAITPIVEYMISTNPKVQRTAAMALEKLSEDSKNAITMHRVGVVPLLLETIGSTDPITQSSSAGCIKNMRKLALNTEEFLLKHDA